MDNEIPDEVWQEFLDDLDPQIQSWAEAVEKRLKEIGPSENS